MSLIEQWDPMSWVSTVIAVLTMLMSTQANMVFSLLFAFRYARLIVNTIAFYGIYKPTPIPSEPTVHPKDCTVIIPTVDPENDGFLECIRTVLQNQPGAVLIVTVGQAKVKVVNKVVNPFRKSWPSTKISVTFTEVANKRLQVCHALPQVNTPITVLVDDHVYWPSLNFLTTICAPFEDRRVGGLGTNKVVRRTGWGYSMSSIFNFWGCVYLERHNFELAATNAIDGSVFVLSGRTSAHRTQILQDSAFLDGFANEMFFFGKFGPIAADDDNFITRWEVKHGWNIKFQYCEDACIETDLGSPSKYISQCMRWVRTTWRSNSCSLFTDRTVWRRQPWGVYAIYISSFFNFALFYDGALVYTLMQTTFGHSWNATMILGAWIFVSKMIKLIPHFRRNPADIMLIPAYLAFAYFHSLMKFWALLTFWDVAWSGRNLAAVNAEAEIKVEDDSDDSDNDDDDNDANGHRPQSPRSDASFNSTGSHFGGSHGSTRSRSLKSGSTQGSNRTWTAQGSYPGDSIGSRQVLFSRHFDSNSEHATVGPALPSLAPSSGSSTQSASWGIAQWSAWEKASNQSTSFSRSLATQIHIKPAISVSPLPQTLLLSQSSGTLSDSSDCRRRSMAPSPSPTPEHILPRPRTPSPPRQRMPSLYDTPPRPTRAPSRRDSPVSPEIYNPSPFEWPFINRVPGPNEAWSGHSSPSLTTPKPDCCDFPLPSIESVDNSIFPIPGVDCDYEVAFCRPVSPPFGYTAPGPTSAPTEAAWKFSQDILPATPSVKCEEDVVCEGQGVGYRVSAARAVCRELPQPQKQKRIEYKQRTRGANCRRQHVNGDGLSELGKCTLPHIRDVGLQ